MLTDYMLLQASRFLRCYLLQFTGVNAELLACAQFLFGHLRVAARPYARCVASPALGRPRDSSRPTFARCVGHRLCARLLFVHVRKSAWLCICAVPSTVYTKLQLPLRFIRPATGHLSSSLATLAFSCV